MKFFLAHLAFALLLVPSLKADGGTAADLQDRIQKIVIPAVSFKNRSIEEALDFLQTKSVELDGDPDPTQRGVTFVLVPQDAAVTARIDYSGSDVTLATVLREIAVPSYDVYLTSVGIVVCPKGQSAFPNPKARVGEVLGKL